MGSIKQAQSHDATRRAIGFPDSLQPWWKRWHEFGRYVFFGGLNAILTYGIYLLCLYFIPYRMAYTVSFVCGIFISYFFNAQFVFKKGLQITKALQFALVFLALYFVGLGLLFVLVEVVHITKWFAPILLIFVIVPVNFWLSRRVLIGGTASSRTR